MSEKKEHEIFDSAEELNRKAKELYDEGNIDGIRQLAKENGLDPEDVEDYLKYPEWDLATPTTFAIGKIEKECEGLEVFGAFETWKGYLLEAIINDPEFLAAVGKRDKTLIDAFAAVLKEEAKSRKAIDKRICKAAGIPENVQMSTRTKKDKIKILREYYMEGKE